MSCIDAFRLPRPKNVLFLGQAFPVFLPTHYFSGFCVDIDSLKAEATVLSEEELLDIKKGLTYLKCDECQHDCHDDWIKEKCRLDEIINKLKE